MTTSPAQPFPENRPDHELRTAIVSGGAGGIGSVICRRMADEGYAVVVADSNSEAAESLANSLPTTGEATHHGFSGDLTESSVNRELAEFAGNLAPIGLIVNAVGISPKKNGEKIRFFDLDDDLWNTVLAVNLSAPFYLMREAYRFMPTDGTASIINLLSITARTGTGAPHDSHFGPFIPSTVAYGATKAALHNLTVSIAHELADSHIRVNGVAPGYVRTPMMGSVPADERLLSSVPMNRFAEPEEVADSIAFLAGSRASYITGTSLDVNGGWATC
ncbi:SDR family NAD(P)-dependent oxidoreductase [Brevibacterium sp. UCMA 11754]|uniref:SDR family NAD(P)-dependent oxidoreductase n=1 Tax=Brevibacterium sp. UCMA 11754 TaxID=2749198 RepID=UPI001F24E52D|nr:SDR family oxidoreductase [Brevibacterium sp. UCMA 11754]MCF2573860.1 SDR family oxidoreductase [Brevibacterium sp. UCMA 11754]